MECSAAMEKIREIIMFNDKDFYPLFYDIVYNNFIDRMENKQEITSNEFYEIINDMGKQLFPYLPSFLIKNIIVNHGWSYECETIDGVFKSGYKLINQ